MGELLRHKLKGSKNNQRGLKKEKRKEEESSNTSFLPRRLKPAPH